MRYVSVSPPEIVALHRDFYNPLKQLWDNHNPIYDAFDDWVLIRTDEDHQNVTEIVLKPKTEEHIETIFW